MFAGVALCGNVSPFIEGSDAYGAMARKIMKPLLTDDMLLGEADGGQGVVHARERNLFEFAKAAWRYRWLALWILLLALSGAVAFVVAMPRQYTAEAVLQLDTSDTEYADFEAVVSQQDVDELAVASEIYVLASYPVALQVVNELGLIDDAEFNPSLREPSYFAGLIDNVVNLLPTDDAAASGLEPTVSTSAEGGQADEVRVADNLLKNLSVWNEGRSYTIFASFQSEDREKAAEIVNTFAKVYLQRQLDTNSETTQQVSSWLGQRLEEARRQVRDAEAKIEAYREENQLVNISGENGLDSQQLSQINLQLAEESVKRSELDARLTRARELMAEGNAYSIPEVINSPVIQQLRAEATVLDRRRAELAATLGDNHPTMVAVQSDRERLDSKIDSEVINIVEGLSAEHKVAVARQAKLRKSLGELRQTVGNVERANVKLQELEREAETNRTLLQSLATRRGQTLALQDAQQSHAELVAMAVPPLKPSHPNKIAAFGLSLAGWLGLSLLLITVIEYRDRDRLRTPVQLQRLFGLPCYGMVPELGTEANKGWFSWRGRANKDSQAIHDGAVGRVRNAIFRDRPDQTSRMTVLVSSSLPEEGKSTFSVALARAFASTGRQTLLIDTDIHRPMIKTMLELGDLPKDDDKPGRVRQVKGAKGKLDALLLAGLVDDEPTGDKILSPALRDLIKETASSYDVTVIDTPPVVLMDDASMLADLADTIVYLVRWNETPIEAVRTGVARLRSAESGAPIRMVLSRTDLARHARFGYKDESYFSEQYGYYYSRA